MTGSRLLVPIRVPEFGPTLSKLTVESSSPDPVGRDAVRMQLITRLFESAGDCRRLASQNDREAALGCLSREAWLFLWEEAIVQLSTALGDYAAARIAEQARVVRLPRRLRLRLEVTDEDRRAISSRLGASGSDLVNVLDDVATASASVVDATADHEGALAAWQESQLRAARRLEEAWFSVEKTMRAEIAYWDDAARQVGQWKKSPLPVILFLCFGSVVALWLGLIMGGYTEPPRWFAALWAAVF